MWEIRRDSSFVKLESLFMNLFKDSKLHTPVDLWICMNSGKLDIFWKIGPGRIFSAVEQASKQYTMVICNIIYHGTAVSAGPSRSTSSATGSQSSWGSTPALRVRALYYGNCATLASQINLSSSENDFKDISNYRNLVSFSLGVPSETVRCRQAAR